MKIEDLDLWNLTPDPVERCEIKCPECGEWSSHEKWSETEVYCEDCGSHTAIKCPECEEAFDHVWSKEFKTRVVC